MLDTAVNGTTQYRTERSEPAENSIGTGLKIKFEHLIFHWKQMTETININSPDTQLESFLPMPPKSLSMSSADSTMPRSSPKQQTQSNNTPTIVSEQTDPSAPTTPANACPPTCMRRLSGPDAIEKARAHLNQNSGDLHNHLRNGISSDPSPSSNVNSHQMVNDSDKSLQQSNENSSTSETMISTSFSIAPPIVGAPMPSIPRPQPSFLPRLTTTFAVDNENMRYCRTPDDDYGLATLPSPATSTIDLPAVHHVRHTHPYKVQPPTSPSTYQHHLAVPKGHRHLTTQDGNDERSNKPVGNHLNDSELGLTGHHSLQQRLAKLGLAKSSEMIGHYAVIKTIGRGSFSEVKLAMDLGTCGKVAIKMISTKGIQNSERLKASAMREVELLKFMDHPNVVRLNDTVDTSTHLCLIVEYVPGGELFDYVNDYYEKTNEEDAKRIFLQLVNVVAYLHDNNIVHRDLKLENVLLTEREPSPTGPIIKLADFGLARFIDPKSPHLSTRCGSEEYAAPELVMGQPYDGRQTDIWSLGIILYALLVGYLPFNMESGQSRRQFFSKIARADFEFPNQSRVRGRRSTLSEEAKDLIMKILQRNPQKRANLDQIRQHPWLQGDLK